MIDDVFRREQEDGHKPVGPWTSEGQDSDINTNTDEWFKSDAGGFKNAQHNDTTLSNIWNRAREGDGEYLVEEGYLYRTNKTNQDGSAVINVELGACKKAQLNDPTLADLGTPGVKGDDKYIADKGRFCRLGKLPRAENGANAQSPLPLNVAPTCRKRAFELAHDYTWTGFRGAKADKTKNYDKPDVKRDRTSQKQKGAKAKPREADGERLGSERIRYREEFQKSYAHDWRDKQISDSRHDDKVRYMEEIV